MEKQINKEDLIYKAGNKKVMKHMIFILIKHCDLLEEIS